MAEDNTEVPVWGDELKYLINTAGSESPSWQDITHLLSWEDEGDEQAYEPSYIDQHTNQNCIFCCTLTWVNAQIFSTAPHHTHQRFVL